MTARSVVEQGACDDDCVREPHQARLRKVLRHVCMRSRQLFILSVIATHLGNRRLAGKIPMRVLHHVDRSCHLPHICRLHLDFQRCAIIAPASLRHDALTKRVCDSYI